VNLVICEGCGRAPGASEVYCAACGRELPGRKSDADAAGSDAAPPGWLVAAGARGEGGFFEPMPTVPVSVPEGPGWRVRATAGVPGAVAVSTVAPAPPPRPLPVEPGPVTEAAAPVAATHEALVVPRRAPLRLLYGPLLAVVILSSVGAVTLLVLHVALHR